VKYINRVLESEILKYLDDKEIIAIIGPRQSGKTTLVKHIISNIKNKKVKQISFDNIFDLELFENDIDGFIDLNVRNYDILFIDEIQYSKQSGKRLKYIYDNNDIKIFISGSSSIDISVESLKYLVGRIFVFTLYPFNFYEFLLAKDENLAEILKNGKIGDSLHTKLLKYLDEFIKFGGFPRVVLENSIEKKKTILQNIFQTYIMKEIKEIFSIKNDFKIFNLMKILSFQEGNLISYEELATHTEINRNVLKEYLNILEKAFIIKLVHSFYTNKRLEIIKSPKLYFLDSGLRNIVNDFTLSGSIYENFVFTEMLKKGIELKYWRTKSKAEIDFVYEKRNELIPIEVKTKLTKPKITKSFYSFIKKYKPKLGYILSRDFEKLENVNNCKVIFSTFVKFLQNNGL